MADGLVGVVWATTTRLVTVRGVRVGDAESDLDLSWRTDPGYLRSPFGCCGVLRDGCCLPPALFLNSGLDRCPGDSTTGRRGLAGLARRYPFRVWALGARVG